MKYTIYKLLFPNKKVYIGKTRSVLVYRWGNGNNYGKTTDVGKAIAEFGWENVEKLVLYENLTEEEANKLEDIEINNHGGINHPLILNERGGGDRGFKLSEEMKIKISERNKKFYTEHSVSEETRKKKSDSLKKHHAEHPESWESCKIKTDQYSYDGKILIATYDSIYDAERATGIEKSAIRECMIGLRHSAGGFRWMKHGKTNPILYFKDPGAPKVKVAQIDKNTGEILGIYESLHDAHRKTGICLSDICRCAQNKQFTAGGYIWKRTN